MLNENLENETFVELTDTELEGISGGKTEIGAVTGNTNVRTGPGLQYKSIGVLYSGDEAKYLGKSAKDKRGVVWYKIDWNGRDAWVSSKYTRKAKY